MKKVMPFVAFTKERVAQVGLGALDLTLEFDGKAVLERDAAYLANNLQAWLPDGYSRIFRIVCVWPFGLLDYGSATLRCKI